MEPDYSLRAPAATKSRSGVRLIIGAVLTAFLLGAAATWLLIAPEGVPLGDVFQVRSDRPAAEETAAEVPAAPAESTPSPEIAALLAERESDLGRRLAAMEQRLTTLDVQAEAAAGNAARAEGLLIAFATRRAIERGAPLGYLEDQLRLRFADAQPNAVQTVIAASRDPVTLDRLLARLDGLATGLTGAPPGEGVLGWLSRELGSLFVVRREDAPSPAPERRIERARLFLESGRAGAAASEIRNLPNAEEAADWIADAERYAATQRALELLELTAILEPRELRDAEGAKVEQPSAVAAEE